MSAKSLPAARVSRSKGGGAKMAKPAGPMKMAKRRSCAPSRRSRAARLEKRAVPQPPVWRSRRSAAQDAAKKK